MRVFLSMNTQYYHSYFVQTFEGTEAKVIMLGKEPLWLGEHQELYCEELKFTDVDPLDYYLEYFALRLNGSVVYKGMLSFASESFRVRYESGFALVNMANVKMIDRKYSTKTDLLRVELQFTCRNQDRIGEPLKVTLYGYRLDTLTSPFPASEEPARTGVIRPSKMNDVEEDPF